MTTEYVSRRAVRHALLRARNARVSETRDASMPVQLRMAQRTLDELLTDGDPHETHTLDFEGFEFMNIPIVIDPRLAPGDVCPVWPTIPDRKPSP